MVETDLELVWPVGILLEPILSRADGPALRPDGPRSGRFAPGDQTVPRAQSSLGFRVLCYGC
jgi:hypothetical protein